MSKYKDIETDFGIIRTISCPYNIGQTVDLDDQILAAVKDVKAERNETNPLKGLPTRTKPEMKLTWVDADSCT